MIYITGPFEAKIVLSKFRILPIMKKEQNMDAKETEKCSQKELYPLCWRKCFKYTLSGNLNSTSNWLHDSI